jgi:hypothetical protein
MKNSPLTNILLGVLTISALLSLALFWLYIGKSRELRTLQTMVNSVNMSRAVAPALANDAIEYSKKHPEIDPLLEACGVKPPKGAPASTNKPASK